MSLLDRLRKNAKGDVIRAALYARFSSDNQRNESIDAQVRAIKEFANSNNIVIVSEYIDRAKSATTDDRPEFQRMIEESGKGNFQLLIVHKLDRFARNRNDSIAYRMKLQRNKVALLSVLEPFDEDRPETILLQSVIEGMNEFYSRNLAREVRKGLKENALKCKHTGGLPPLGYDVDKNTRLLVINESEAEAVKLIFRMFLEGKTYDNIIKTLNFKGFKTKTNKNFGKNSLYEILRNPKYKGIYIYNKSSPQDPYTKKRNSHRHNDAEDMIIIDGGVPAIISEDEFDAAKKLMDKRKRYYRGASNKQEIYLLTGKIFCGKCGHTYTGNRKKSSGNRLPIVTYRCNNQSRGTNIACDNREINRDYIEDFVIKQLEGAIFNKESAKIIINQFKEYLQAKNQEMSQTLKRLEGNIKEIDEKLKNLGNALADALTTRQRQIILENMEKLEDEKIAFEEYILREKSALALDIPSEEELNRCFNEAKSMFRERSLANMQELIDLYVEKIIVFEDEVEVILNLVPFVYRHEFSAIHRRVNRYALYKK